MSNHLSICHVLASHKEIGGLEKNVIDLANKQARQGHEVFVLTTQAYLGKFGDGVKTMDAKLERGRKDFRLKWQLQNIIKELNPHIVHAHANKPGHVVGRLKIKSKKIATVQNLKSNQTVFNRFDEVICASQMVADSLPLKDAHVIWNAVAPSNPAHKELGLALKPPFLESGKPIIYAAARFVEAKGFDLLLEAFARTQDCYLWLIGEGRDQELLNGIIKKHNLSKRIWTPGFIKPEEVLGLMLLADCFFISSRNEGGPYTLAEALRAQCAVISTKVGYAPEFLADAQLIKETTIDRIAQSLNHYLKDPSVYKTNMTPIFETADRDLDLDRMVEKVEAVYRKAIAS